MAEQHRLKVRQRFSGFYDVSVRQDGGATDIDGANFDADAYVTQLLKHKQLSELVQVLPRAIHPYALAFFFWRTNFHE